MMGWPEVLLLLALATPDPELAEVDVLLLLLLPQALAVTPIATAAHAIAHTRVSVDMTAFLSSVGG
jgi:hypothetical protein